MLLFQVSSKPVAFVALMFAVFFGLGMGPVLSAFATELFPTEIRGAAAAWIRNWFEISGIFFGPLLVGVLGDHSSGAIGNIGDTVTLLMVLQIPCIWIVWRYMPETRGKELEQIAEDEGMVSTGAVAV
jgi:putative MFS transporter